MSRSELFCLFRSLPEGEVPRAYYQGTVIGRGPALLRPVTAGAVSVVWQGKYVMPEEGLMVNKVCGQAKVTAEYFIDNSWLDGKSATIFDYRCSSAKFARDARDEVRPVCPGLYLGLMWIRQESGCPKPANFFLLERRCRLTSSATEESCSASSNESSSAAIPETESSYVEDHVEGKGSVTTDPSQTP
ncbi:hypothetical protein K2X85_15265 [bacterium]|nr:hypothetical protein [bacterium]